ncbi:MAG TPA: hypothetical protein VJL58_10275, partial [Pyrinomonadaceae bacterium]|nr:hypothetical protein [Pyrinomonadaceae bacterium]
MANITKKGDRKYLIRVSKGTGKRRSYINKTFRGTLKAARAEGRKMESDMDSGISPRAVIRFEEYLKLWLKAIEKKVAPRTYDGYKGYIERYASKPLGRLRLVDIRNHHIQKIYTDIDKAPGTVRQLHASLNACFSWAVRREYLKTNPCRNVDLPLQQRRDMSTLTESETARFTKACHEMPNGLVFVFALQTGMRPEEYLALRW